MRAAIAGIHESPQRRVDGLSPLQIKAASAAAAPACAGPRPARHAGATIVRAETAADPDAVAIGQRVAVGWEDHDDVSIPVFRPLP